MAAALRALDFRVSHVGHAGDKAPRRGATDDAVLDHARRTNQVVVTSNHDLILLCAQERVPVVWIDPRGRQFRRSEMVLICFREIAVWERLLAEGDGPMCVRALRTKSEALTLERAAELVHQRMRRLATRQRARRARTVGDLLKGIESSDLPPAQPGSEL